MCKLTKNLPIQGGCWIFRIQRGGFDKGEGKNSGGVRPPIIEFDNTLSVNLVPITPSYINPM